MKKVLITGANSYIGESTQNYLLNNGDYVVDVLDMLTNWQDYDLSSYDVIFNVAAIVHRPKEQSGLYYKINRDMVAELAKKAKASGVKHFIQMSTANVFGIDLGVMDENTPLKPYSDYGKSKLEADELLMKMCDDSFAVCIVRPPMIYGKGCRGNYPTMEKFALKSPVFPSLKNKKDFIFIDNMSDAIKFYIDHSISGVCYPRDREPVSTCKIVKTIAELNNKKIHLWGVFNPFVKLFLKLNHTLILVFGDNYYDIDDHTGWIAPISLDEGLARMYGSGK